MKDLYYKIWTECSIKSKENIDDHLWRLVYNQANIHIHICNVINDINNNLSNRLLSVELNYEY